MTQRTIATLKLTPEQREAVRKATGRDSDAIELQVGEELEERINPYSPPNGGRFLFL